MKRSLTRNFAYQTIYQVLVIILPLITSPYLSRVLGVENLGIFAYTSSIISYFILFAMLGTNNYGTREIAICGENRKERSYKFFEIYIFEFFLTIICTIFYLFYIFSSSSENMIITIIQGFSLVASLLDINWLFFGVEDFKTTVTRNILIKIISFCLIILLVKKSSDLWIYTSIMVGSTLTSNAILWCFVSKYIDFFVLKNISMNKVLCHIKGNFILFIPLMAMSVYHVMDKTMLGVLSTYSETGYYYNADKIVSTPVGLINGFCTVMLPRMSNLMNNKQEKKAYEYFSNSIYIIAAFTFAISCGIAAVAPEFTPIFFGKGYNSCIILIILLSPIIPIKGYCYLSRILYLIPSHLEKIYISSVFVGAITNLIINFMLIPKYGAIGACIGTVGAELSSCVWQFLRMNKYISLFSEILKSLIYLLLGILMVIIVRYFSNLLPKTILGLFAEIIVGAFIYILLCIVYWIAFDNKIFKNILVIVNNKSRKRGK